MGEQMGTDFFFNGTDNFHKRISELKVSFAIYYVYPLTSIIYIWVTVCIRQNRNVICIG